jgi:hypothetical protein
MHQTKILIFGGVSSANIRNLTNSNRPQAVAVIHTAMSSAQYKIFVRYLSKDSNNSDDNYNSKGKTVLNYNPCVLDHVFSTK